ncbi:MAG: molybdenum cofactor guanylyltransferase MobA [Gammaproteobacteria bacterium]
MSDFSEYSASYPSDTITGLVLAGGRGTRMGGADKGLVEALHRPLIAWVLDRLRPQVGPILINHARNTERYAAFGYPLVTDREDGFLGPLAGVASAMPVTSTPLMLTVPCDTPGLGDDLGPRLHAALMRDQAEIAVAHDGEWLQPLFMMLRTDLQPSLAAFLSGGGRKVDKWFAQHAVTRVDFSDWGNAFANLNTAEELHEFESTAGRASSSQPFSVGGPGA